MPKMDGMTLMKQIREDSWGKAVPIIILTNLNIDGELLNKIIKYKPVYSLLKANTVPEDVLAKIREVLGNAK